MFFISGIVHSDPYSGWTLGPLPGGVVDSIPYFGRILCLLFCVVLHIGLYSVWALCPLSCI